MGSIKCSKVVKTFNNPPLTVLKSITLEVEQGEFVGITGRSGSGKSTLLYIVSGLDNPTTGEVLLGGKNIHAFTQEELHAFRNSEIGFVFQFHYLLPELGALDNILMPARKSRQENTRLEYALHLMDEFRITHCREKLPSQMSGGEMQRTAIARALIMNPKILFADEPTGNLDTENGDRVMEIFTKENKTNGTTIMMVTHEQDYARQASRQIVMADGNIHKDSKSTPGRKKQ